MERIPARYPQRSLDHRSGSQSALAHGRLPRREVPAVFGTDPPVETPVLTRSLDQTSTIDRGRRVVVVEPDQGRAGIAWAFDRSRTQAEHRRTVHRQSDLGRAREGLRHPLTLQTCPEDTPLACSLVAPAVLIPIKSFDLAKGRLADALSPAQRAELALAMATTVIVAARRLPTWVVCDDSDVAAFATSHGAGVIWRPSRGLNAAVKDGFDFLRNEGHTMVVIAHADLPRATDLSWVPDFAGVTIVPDRRGDGTNVMAVPTTADFRFQYGVGSSRAHQAEALRLTLPYRIVDDPQLGWDVDVPEDLSILDPAAGADTP